MNKILYRAAGAAGLLAIAWVAAGYIRSPLALAMCAAIAAFYVMGMLELQRYQQATQGLDDALAQLNDNEAPPALADWLARVPDTLRAPVRLRVEGDRVAFAGPALAPYLAGLLVLLGMLGTFLGMVVTLNGTGAAMAQAADVNALRESLAAPVRGLGLAFGTSVAGVAGSAMLGLMSALCRRARQQAALRLEGQIAGPLRGFSRASLQAERAQQQAREQAEQQARLLQPLVDRLQALSEQLAQQSQQTAAQLAQHGQHTAEQLLAGQQRFHADNQAVFRTLATSVEDSLQRSLTHSARLAADTLQPAVATTLEGITRETAALHGRIAAGVQQQLDGLAQRFEQQASAWVDTLGTQARQQAQALQQTLDQAQARQQQQAAALGEITQQTAAQHSLLTQHTAQLLDGLAQRFDQQTGRWLDAAAAQQQAQASTLLDTLAERQATQLAAWEDVVTQLRAKLSESLAHDNSLLAERTQIMGTLHTLLGAVQHTSTEQKAAIDALVAASANWLETAGARFTEQVNTESARLEAVAAQLGASAVDVASLGEAFGGAVAQFSQSSTEVLAHLQRVEETLAKASTRSDEQLAYYVAQAREVIDLSLLSQKQIVEDLQRLARRSATGEPA